MFSRGLRRKMAQDGAIGVAATYRALLAIAVGGLVLAGAVVILGPQATRASEPTAPRAPAGSLAHVASNATNSCASGTGMNGTGGGWVNITSSACGPAPRRSAAVAYDPEGGFILLFGGYEATYGWFYFNDTWEFSNGSWTEVYPAQSPPALGAAAMAWDPGLNAVVLFGGVAYGLSYNETWEFAAGTWTQISTSHAPSPRFSPAMAYDYADEYLVLYGGDTDPQLNVDVGLGDTWAFNGVTWAQLSPAVSPPARFPGEMAWDPLDHYVVLFGGWNTTGGASPSFYYNDTWAFAGGSWTRIATTSAPSPRVLTALASYAGGVMLFGGNAGSTAYNDTWSYAGGNWTLLSVGTAPGDRTGTMMSFDPNVGCMILYGGVDRGVWLGGTFALCSPAVLTRSGGGGGDSGPGIRGVSPPNSYWTWSTANPAWILQRLGPELNRIEG